MSTAGTRTAAHRRVLAVLLAVVVSVGFLPQTAVGAPAPSHLVMASGSPAVTATVTPSTVAPGGSTTMRATYTKGGTPVPAATLVVQKYSGGRWVDAVELTVKNGVGTRTIRPKGTTTYRVRNYNGSAVSRSVQVTVSSAKVTASVSPTTVGPGASTTLRVTYSKNGTPVPAATLTIQKISGGRWVDAASVAVRDGVGSRTIRPNGTTTYRVRNYNGSALSATFKVTVSAVPASFTIKGSGYGHGVGMSQYGAYGQALEGRGSTTILQHYYQGTKVLEATTPLTVRVQVFGPEPYSYPKGKYSDTASSTTVRIGEGRWRLRNADDVQIANGVGPTTITVSVSGSEIRATVGGKTYRDSKLYLHWGGTRYYYQGDPATVVKVDGAHGSYRHGRFVMTPIAGVPNVVNELRLNTEYLYGIAEMPSSWGVNGLSALAAQAIAARSYALTRPYKSACACDVVDDVRDQYFSGWNKENESRPGTTDGYYGSLWKKGVDATTTSTATRAKVLTYGGRAIATHYFSSSGGRTENSEDVWSSVVAYERGVSDPWSLRAPGNSMTSWTRTITQARAASLFGLSDVKTIKVTQTYGGGAMRRLTATSSSGQTASITDKADKMRYRLGAATTTGSLPSPWVTSVTS